MNPLAIIIFHPEKKHHSAKCAPAGKLAIFKKNHIEHIGNKDAELLSRFIGADGKIAPRAVGGTSAIKKARFMGLSLDAK